MDPSVVSSLIAPELCSLFVDKPVRLALAIVVVTLLRYLYQLTVLIIALRGSRAEDRVEVLRAVGEVFRRRRR